ncbi:MAG: hypothetical protein MJ228_05090 [Bacilli bacterium]|nr:hypothetical protein [Bacilli bacterium]
MKKMKKSSYILSAIALCLLAVGIICYVLIPAFSADLLGALKQLPQALVGTVTFKGAKDVAFNGIPFLLIFDILGIILFALFAITFVESFVLSLSKKRFDLIGASLLWLVTGFFAATFIVMSFVSVSDATQVGILFEGNAIKGEWYHDFLGFVGQAFAGGDLLAGIIAILSFVATFVAFVLGLVAVIMVIAGAIRFPVSAEAKEELEAPIEEEAKEEAKEEAEETAEVALSEESKEEALKAEEQKPVIIQNFYNGSLNGKPSGETASANEIRSIIREELKALAAKDEAEDDDCMTADDIRLIIREEVVAALKSLQIEAPAPAKETVIEEPVAPAPKEPEPVAQEAPAVEETPVAQEAPVAQEPLEVVSEEEEEGEATKESKPVIRLSFSEKMVKSDIDIMEAYNELKAYALSYGLKSRISNAGDTFRLHLKTYLRINVVGKNLKLYYALNPADYKDSTIPVKDVSKKGMYAEIPLCLKVRSGLSIKRAKMLIDDVCGKEGLVADKPVELRDFAREVSDSVEEE